VIGCITPGIGGLCVDVDVEGVRRRMEKALAKFGRLKKPPGECSDSAADGARPSSRDMALRARLPGRVEARMGSSTDGVDRP
jgi:hypothetical protein